MSESTVKVDVCWLHLNENDSAVEPVIFSFFFQSSHNVEAKINRAI